MDRRWRPIAGSVQFFLITNFGRGWRPAAYGHTLAGLFSLLHAAIPFFRNTLVSDLSMRPSSSACTHG